LFLDGFSLGVVKAEASELASADFLLSVFEEYGFVDNSEDFATKLDSYFLLSSKGCLLLIGY
jgi:hypothetical protein